MNVVTKGGNFTTRFGSGEMVQNAGDLRVMKSLHPQREALGHSQYKEP